MRRKTVKRLHSEDARFLRSMLYDILARLNEVEYAVGHLQTMLPARENEATEIVEEALA